MAGHSAYANIKHRKDAQDAKKGAIFTRLAQNVTLAAKSGGDLDMNPSLRLAVEKARAANMPKDNIERAIKKGTGELGGEQIQEVLYEAFGPEGIAVLIKCVTDNTNRSITNTRTVVTKSGGNFANVGSVSWMFQERGIIEIEKKDWNDNKELLLIEAGALDIEVLEDVIIAITEKTALHTVREALEKAGFVIKDAKLSYIPKDEVAVADKERVLAFLDKIEDSDDVNEVFTNANLS